MRNVIIVFFSAILMAQNEPIKLGSKSFNESYILTEIMAQLLVAKGFEVEIKHGLGGALIAYESLKNGEIDIYPDYSGTVLEAILKKKNLTINQMNDILSHDDVEIRPGYGFNNTYAIVIDGEIARSNSMKNISDLAHYPDLKLGFSNEFLKRQDGWPGLAKMYGLSNSVIGMEHALAYDAIQAKSIVGTDAYSTDGDLPNYDLVILEDDRLFFPRYDAFPLIRKSLPEHVKSILNLLENQIDENQMQALNRMVMVDKKSYKSVAAEFLKSMSINVKTVEEKSTLNQVMSHTVDHLILTFTAVILGCLIAIPFSLMIYRNKTLSRSLVYISGLFQTIPSLALLAFMIPLFGLGFVPAIIALFLYSLLPIVRNTITGLESVDPLLKDVAEGMGLTKNEQLRQIELPLAKPTILAGIKTATIISIGTATLAAFIGGGGLGELIITGLTLNDMSMILSGAIPAAVLAIIVEIIFEFFE